MLEEKRGGGREAQPNPQPQAQACTGSWAQSRSQSRVQSGAQLRVSAHAPSDVQAPEATRGEALRRRLRDLLSVYVIVNASTPLELVEQLLDAGVGTIQLREKELPPPEQAPVAKELQALCQEKGALFVVNDFVDVALDSGADGVHVGQEDEAAASARRRLGPEKIIGVSARTPEEARRATADGADYLGVGPVYTSKTKMVRAPGGPELIARMREATKLPIVGIAGIGPGNAGPVIAAGADGVAVISAVLDAPDPVEVARALLEEVARAKRGRG